MDTKDLFDQGLKTSKLQDRNTVSTPINNADEFGMKLQEFMNSTARFKYGRYGLKDAQHDKYCSALAALGRTHEFRLHLSGAINNGVTKETAEI